MLITLEEVTVVEQQQALLEERELDGDDDSINMMNNYSTCISHLLFASISSHWNDLVL